MDKEIFSQLQSIYDERGFEELLKKLFQLAKEDDILQKDVEELAKSFFDITAGGGDYFDTSVAIVFKYLYDKFPNSRKLKNNFADICSELKNNGIFFLEGNITQSQSLQNTQIITRSQTYQTKSILEKIRIVIDNTLTSYSKDYDSTFDKICIDARCMSIGLHIATYFLKDGKFFKIKGNISSFDLMDEIKCEMYEQAKHEGAWFFCNIEVSSNLEYTINFNYDDKDKLPEEKLKTPDNFEDEFSDFPRSKEFTPEWWQKILDKKVKYLK